MGNRKIKKNQSSFTSGQQSTDMAGRDDVKHFYAGAETLKNMLIKPTGGVTRRAGLTMVEEITDVTADNGVAGIFIHEHRFNQDQTYLIMGTHKRARIYHQGTKVWENAEAPWTGAQANEIWRMGALDTTLLLQQQIQPHRLLRQGAHDKWILEPKVLENIPQYNFEDANSPGGISAPTKENIWSDLRGWPRAGDFHGDRLVLGGSTDQSSKWAASVVSEYFNFDEGDGKDDLAVVAQANSDEGDGITAIFSQKHLIVITGGGEFATLDYPMTPKKVSSIGQSNNGGAAIKPVSVERGILFISAQRENERQALLECLYAGEADQAYDTQDLSILAGDLIRSPVRDLALRRGNEEDRAMHVFVVNDDGSVAVLNTLRKQDITGWSEIQSRGASGTDKLLRTCVVGSTVFFTTERTIGGVKRFFLEKMEYDTWLDCSKKVTSETEETVFQGFDHLIGETVRLWAHDGDRGEVVVAQDGSITLDYPTTSLEAGYTYDWQVTPMPFVADLPDGTSFMSIQRVVASEIMVKNTAEFYVNGKLQQFRKFGDGLLDQGLPLFSGLKRVTHLGYDRKANVNVHGTAPGPATILSILREVSV